MRLVPVSAVGRVPADLIAVVSGALSDRRTLADVLQWARDQVPPVHVSEIVTQDEYTHDVVLPFDGTCFLVLDAT
jgi:hypothetical protein